MLFKDLSIAEIFALSQENEIIFISYAAMNNFDYTDFEHNIQDFAKRFDQVPFILLNEQLKDQLNLPIDLSCNMTYFIFRKGYMLFKRENMICYDDLNQSFKFAAHLNMQLWIAEDLRFKLLC